MNEDIDIIALEFPENIRRRAGMYIGATDNPSVLLREAIDNSIDELYGAECTNQIFIKTSNSSSIYNVVADNGRGIPIKWDEDHQMTKMELACTGIHTGSKFNKTDVAIGLNGVGISASRALSKEFYILSRITKDNYIDSTDVVRNYYTKNNSTQAFFYIKAEKGYKVDEGILTEDEVIEKFGVPKGMSTITVIAPDPEIFDSVECSVPVKNLTYVFAIMEKIYHRHIRITVNDVQIHNEFVPYQYEFVKKINREGRSATFYINFELDKMMNVADFSGSVNSLIVDRGLNIEVAKRAYSDALKSVFNLNYQNVLCGIKINSIAIAPEVDFSSQTKERCTKIENFQGEFIVSELTPEFKKIMKANFDEFESHVQRLTEYINSLTKISTINKIKSAIGTIGGGSRVRSKIPKSVRDAAANQRDECELFIVEGRSAGGSVINTRDPRTQAVMELRGVN